MRMEDLTQGGEFVDKQVRIDHWGSLTFEAWVEEGRTEEGDMERMVREVGGELGDNDTMQDYREESLRRR